MADISKCAGLECSLKETCYRFTAIASPHWQSYAPFKPNEDGSCDDYWDDRPPAPKKKMK